MRREEDSPKPFKILGLVPGMCHWFHTLRCECKATSLSMTDLAIPLGKTRQMIPVRNPPVYPRNRNGLMSRMIIVKPREVGHDHAPAIASHAAYDWQPSCQ